MGNTVKNNEVLKEMVELLELPESAYEKAKNRYEDLGKWLAREESSVKNKDPHIFPQGSFLLGTAIRPLNGAEKYDLDLACNLKKGITRENYTQEELKNIVGSELGKYRKERGLKEGLKSKHRCWRLLYQDGLQFHMDIVPCIPSDESIQEKFFKYLVRSGMGERMAMKISQTTVNITDDHDNEFGIISDSWQISNPEGYGNWFVSRMRMNQSQNQSFASDAKVTSVPVYKRKNILQRVIQLLKRHRDCWSKDNPEAKPISIIITTLAARAYNGESELSVALGSILQKMEGLVNATIPKVPNPVNPEEDFADKWNRQDSRDLQLEKHFFAWLQAVKDDFETFDKISDPKELYRHIDNKFCLKIDIPDAPPKTYDFKKKDNVPRPWSNM